MVSIDVRQAQLLLLFPRDGLLKVDLFLPTPLPERNLLWLLGSYLGRITPNLADDATVALRAIVELFCLLPVMNFSPKCHLPALFAKQRL